MTRMVLEQVAENIERWKERFGVCGRDYVPANSGATRTRSKNLLLQAIARDAAARGESPRFAATYDIESSPKPQPSTESRRS